MEGMDKMFEGIDVFISPNYAQNLLTITNYTGTPQLIFRAGFIETPTRLISGDVENEDGPKHKVPVGFSVYGPLYGEGPMITVAKALEEKLGAVNERPKL
jgi:Asp-tRNA(Asn)/Glu-tRNA(Gln) amidotransferase A subunit family amidase